MLDASSSARPAERPSAWPLSRRWTWVLSAAGLIVVSALVVEWARTRPGYDPYGWLVWGYQTIHLNLNLGGAPSWKPLPYLFTVPYALAGHEDELRLWMVTAVAVSLAGAIFGARIAFRATGGWSSQRPLGAVARCAPWVAAAVAGACVLGLQDYLHYILSVQSDPMIVTFCLAAIDQHLSGRYRWAFVCAALGALGRPEVWPFLAVYSVWLWRRVPGMRWMVAAGIAVVAFMWFGIPWITNGRPNIAGQLAQKSPRELHQDKFVGTIARFTELHYLPVWIAALVAVTLAVWRRDRLVLTLAAGIVVWVIVEIAFAFHGFPALPRYMFEAAAVAAVLAGIAVGWVLTDLPRLRAGLPPWVGVPAAVILVAVMVPGAVGRLRTERTDLKVQRGRTNEIGLLATTIDKLGGYRHVRACGEPVTIVEYASVLAWTTDLNVGSVGYLPGVEKRRRYPIVLFATVSPGGWEVRPWHTRRRQLAACSGLRSAYLLTKRHPSGALVHA